MKSSFDKLRRFALHKNDAKDKLDVLSSAHLDELAQAAQDMQDMRNCYDSLLSAAAATANSAYEFSESLQEMGSCLREKRVLPDDEESSRILLMLGNLQFELQKLVDNYRAHILLTITNPSESLLNELRTVEDMKRQCDEKRNVYEYMVTQQKEKGRLKGGKGETLTLQQLQTARDEYDEVATLCVFRLKSLKQGQSRSLLTQAARHHAAQLNFFRKGLKSLEAIEPHVRQVTEQQHIDYQFSGLEDDDGEDGELAYDPNEDGELSFDYRANEKGLDVTSASRNSMEVDEIGRSYPQTSKMENAEVNLEKSHGDILVSSREHRVGSYSAPIFPERKLDPAERVKQMLQSSTRKSNTYVLPTPNDSKSALSSRTISPIPPTRPTNVAGRPHNLWHSSPLEQKKHEKDSGDGQSEFTIWKSESVFKECNSSNTSTQLPPPLSEGPVPTQLDTSSEVKKIKRKAVSGPLTSKQLPTKPLSATGPIPSAELPHLASAAFSHLPIPQPLSPPKVSPSASPPLVSSPRINELHELPRPPGSSAAKPAKSPALIGHSAPLVSRNHEVSTSNIPSLTSSGASPLPTPPLVVPRSFSIPSSNQRAMAIHVSRLLETPQVSEKDGDVASPPLTPISIGNIKTIPGVSEVASHSGQIRGGS
ncbi:Hydroxyproline-rich glycoprotein family protein [Theobroma cacao]|uniref:Hydroxyproline-rich glycoprotein family protein n=1 Tax=Theobroma cacao TaxID=3641 RepID=A0A061ED78_THECC|nr:Hydroxyproline-rich glycoprotein family protein [Theobroma cacao]